MLHSKEYQLPMPHTPTDSPQRTKETEPSGGRSREDWRQTTESCNRWVEPNMPWGGWQPTEEEREAGEDSIDIGYMPWLPSHTGQGVLPQESSYSMPGHGGSEGTGGGQMDQFQPVVDGSDGALREHVGPINLSYAGQEPPRSKGPAWDMPTPRGWLSVAAPASRKGTGGYASQLQHQPVPFSYSVTEAYPSNAAVQQAPYSTSAADQGTSGLFSTPFVGSGGSDESPFSTFENTPDMTTPSWLYHSVGFDPVCVPTPGEFDPTSWDQENFSSDPPSSSRPLFPLTSWDMGTSSYLYPQAADSTAESAMEGGLGIGESGYRKLQGSALLAQSHAWRHPSIQMTTVNEHARFPEVNMALPTPPEAPTYCLNRSGASDAPLVSRRPSHTGLRRIAPMPPFMLGGIGTVSKKRSYTEALGIEAEGAPIRPAKATFPCPIAHCAKMFARTEQAKRHAETARQQMYGVFDFPCTVDGCTKEFRLKHKRKEHIAKVHGTD